MTLPSDPRTHLGPSVTPADPDDALRPSESAITLAELIADSGALPPDAALECVQRLAEQLSRIPAASCRSLRPDDVLIDDDGCVWLRDPQMLAAPAAIDDPHDFHVDGMNGLGRLLVCLATGIRQDEGHTTNAAELPSPLSIVAGRLLSRNGACYSSYADLARETAELRGVAPAIPSESVLVAPSSPTAADQSLPSAADLEPSHSVAEDEKPQRLSGSEDAAAAPSKVTMEEEAPAIPSESYAQESSSGVGATVLAVIVALGAAAAFAAWQWL